MSTPTADQPVIAEDLILLDADLGETKAQVIERLAGVLASAGRATDTDALRDAALAREAQSATGLPGGIAIPHCRSEAVTSASLGFARLNPKVDFGAPDGPADLVFLIAAPTGAGSAHMKLLSSLARALVKPGSRAGQARVRRLAAQRVLGVRDRHARRRRHQPCDQACSCGSRRGGPGLHRQAQHTRHLRRGVVGSQAHRGGHRLPHRNRAHLHGGRLPRRSG